VNVLKEWHRILRPNGLLRLAVPDFEQYVSLYSVNHDLNALLGPMYGRWQIGNTEKIIYHKTTYDFVSLKRVLESCGFKNVRRWIPKDVLPENFDDYSFSYWPKLSECETMETYRNGHLMSLNVECNKH
jgi:predicted SAM-dependent methyltransferase